MSILLCRQKQYFEQKRRQQQRAGLESYIDGKPACTQHCDYSRSLDILSLQNLSTVAQEHNTSTTTANDNLENADFSLNDQDALSSQAIFTNDGVSVDQAEKNKWAPSNGTEAEYPKKDSVHLQNGNGNLAGNFSDLDSFKLPMSHQIRVIDLLGDDSTSNAEENSLRQEGHVAFSIEGLGQVDTETPVHSPKITGRSFLDCYSPPKKAVRVPIKSKHLEYGFHDLGSRLVHDTAMPAPLLMAMLSSLGPVIYACVKTVTLLHAMHPVLTFSYGPVGDILEIIHQLGNVQDVLTQDIDFSPCSSTIDQSFCTRDMINAAGDPKQNFLNFRTPSSYNWNCSNMQGILENDELVYNKRDSSRRIWEGRFLDDGFDDLEEQESFCTNFDGRDVGFDDYYLPKSPWKQDLDFEGWDVNKKRYSLRSPQTYSAKESPGPYPEHLTMKDLHGIGISDKRWHSDIEIGNDVKYNNSVTEDSRSRSLARFEIFPLACTKNHALALQVALEEVLRSINHNNWGLTKTRSNRLLNWMSAISKPGMLQKGSIHPYTISLYIFTNTNYLARLPRMHLSETLH
ncbi:hypothetical protein SASPL_122957 [Salvia splendens]|uniref:Uncharacterized protein n=1 Tax=Salvia splendens TaxID=180675 RepID=A0A8X8ZTI1_SALSN|nr:hypothetical protein SASPL_122957 [Salvia splendens]